MIYVFDAYGTLFDVNSAIMQHKDEVGVNALAIADMWRTKQLEYTWIRTLMNAPYQDFNELTSQALDFTLSKFGIQNPLLRDKLRAAYEVLLPFNDVLPTVIRLKKEGARLGILSNGSTNMLQTAVNAAGLSTAFEQVISVDDVREFKVKSSVYEQVLKKFQTQPHEVTFFSSNRWDAAAARHFGFKVTWVNRAGNPDEYKDFAPHRIVKNLTEI